MGSAQTDCTATTLYTAMYYKVLGLLVLLSFVQKGYTIQCYQCNGEDNLCSIGLLGDKIDCPKSSKSCYKSWTVETSPLTKRKCADDRDYPEECRDALFGQTSMLACYCSDQDFCNSGIKIGKNTWIVLLASSWLTRTLF